MPGVQIPHWVPPSLTSAAWMSLSISPSASPSTVRT